MINFIQMPADILVVTPSQDVGESVRRILEETTLYRIHIANNKSSAIVRADEVGVPLAMLDLALGENGVQEIGTALRTIQRGINLIVLCEGNVTPPAFDTLRPWILVHKPFSMSDFMTAISQPQSAPASQDADLPWLSDENKAAQHLTRLTLSSSAQAALITRKNRLWAYAGGLSQQAAKELAQAVTRNWDAQKGSDLLRFIRLESTKAEHMLYATHIAADSVLALVFDSETPFSTIRNQASQLVADLDNFELPKPSKSVQEELAEADNLDEENIPPITNILTDIPSPNPSPKPKANIQRETRFDPNETRVSEPLADASVFNRESSPAVRLTPVARREPARPVKTNALPQSALEAAAPSRPQKRSATPIPAPASKVAELDLTRKSALTDERTPTPIAPPANATDVTRESPTTQAVNKLVVEPTSAGLYHLTYACLLVPRFSTHYIIGDLADRLGEWMSNLCVAFGWRLEYLSVRPEYLQWVVNVQPNTSPGYLMRIVRQQTSEKIFDEFPRLSKENPSHDFWAPGYLIMGGSQPHPPQLVKDYINQTRQRQGQESSIAPR
ncbi:MAG: transposase [Anaerolineales bacterium]|nr:transposase [Anaerolineales bacterium]